MYKANNKRTTNMKMQANEVQLTIPWDEMRWGLRIRMERKGRNGREVIIQHSLLLFPLPHSLLTSFEFSLIFLSSISLLYLPKRRDENSILSERISLCVNKCTHKYTSTPLFHSLFIFSLVLHLMNVYHHHQHDHHDGQWWSTTLLTQHLFVLFNV